MNNTLQIDCPDIRCTSIPSFAPNKICRGRSWGTPRTREPLGQLPPLPCLYYFAAVPIRMSEQYFSRDWSFFMPPWWIARADVTCAEACWGEEKGEGGGGGVPLRFRGNIKPRLTILTPDSTADSARPGGNTCEDPETRFFSGRCGRLSRLTRIIYDSLGREESPTIVALKISLAMSDWKQHRPPESGVERGVYSCVISGSASLRTTPKTQRLKAT
jgi:hypothetical protein